MNSTNHLSALSHLYCFVGVCERVIDSSVIVTHLYAKYRLLAQRHRPEDLLVSFTRNGIYFAIIVVALDGAWTWHHQ